VERATAEVARAEQDVTAATLSETLARRELRTLTGVEPAGVGEFPVDDLHPEAPLPEWTALTDSVPRLEAARAAERAAQKQTSAAKASLYPILSGSAKERLTNATAGSRRCRSRRPCATSWPSSGRWSERRNFKFQNFKFHCHRQPSRPQSAAHARALTFTGLRIWKAFWAEMA